MKRILVTKDPHTGDYRCQSRFVNGVQQMVCHACGRWYTTRTGGGYVSHVENDCPVWSKSYKEYAFLAGFGGTL